MSGEPEVPPATTTGSGPSRRRSRAEVLREAAWAISASALAVLAAAVHLRLWDAHLRIPVGVAASDTGSVLSLISGIAKHGWWWTDSSLGAPFGTQQFDYAASFTDTANLLIVKAVLLVVDDPAFALNAYFLITFALSALMAHLVLRSLRIPAHVAVVGAVLFALLPYHFLRGIDHAWLTGYWAVPIAVWLVLGAAGHVRVWTARAGVDGWRRLVSWSSARWLAAVLIVVNGGVYYALFGAALLIGVIALRLIRDRNWRAAGPAVLLIGALIGGIVLMTLPAIIYVHQHGPNPVASSRLPQEAELYGLKLVDLLFSRTGERIWFLRDFGRDYSSTTPIPSEGGSPWLGAVLAASFLFGIAYAIVRGAASQLRPDAALVRDSGLLMAWAFVITTVGGLSTVVAFEVSDQIRGYNRISVVIAFLAVVVLSVVLTRGAVLIRARAGRFGAVAVAALLALVTAFGVWNQSAASTPPAYASITAAWRSRAKVVSVVDHVLPAGAQILQLPYVPYPEPGRVDPMSQYDQLLPYVQSTRSDLHWSAGAMKGRPDDWMARSSGLSTRELITGATAAGFAAIWVDNAGYGDNGAQARTDIQATIGSGPIAVSDDGRYVLYLLTPFAGRLRAAVGPGELRAAGAFVRQPVDLEWRGFDTATNARQTWSHPAKASAATITFDPRAQQRRTYVIRARLVAPSPSPVTIALPDGRTRRAQATPKGTPFAARVVMGPGLSVMRLTSDAPDYAGNPALRYSVEGLTTFDVATTAVIKSLAPRRDR